MLIYFQINQINLSKLHLKVICSNSINFVQCLLTNFKKRTKLIPETVNLKLRFETLMNLYARLSCDIALRMRETIQFEI